MPALTIPSPTKNGASFSPSASATTPTAPSTTYSDEYRNRSRSSSPQRPPVSPITPVATLAQLAPIDTSEHVVPPPAAIFIPQPPPVPISESENADAIALRSAISLLQIQREKSKRDIQSLERIKHAALAEPEAFIEEAKAGRLFPKSTSDMLAPTLADALEEAPAEARPRMDSHSHDAIDISSTAPESSAPKFPPVPQPQNIFRCPPINWAKYHVVGESLDKLHAEQRVRPTPGEPSRDQSSVRAPAHVIAAPYSPFTDAMQTRRGSKKPS